MTKQRKIRTDSITGQVNAHASKSEPIVWPDDVTCLSNTADLSAADALFKKIIDSRAQEHWRPLDVVTAAMLANLQVHYNKLSMLLDAEGFIVDGKRNPTFDVVEKVLAKIGQLTRTLGLSGMPADAAVILNAKQLEQDARSTNSKDLNSLFAH